MRLSFVEFDKELSVYKDIINERYKKYKDKLNFLTGNASLLSDSFNNHLYYGLHFCGDCWVIREWAPKANSIYLIGDFNNWEKNESFRFDPVGYGNWELKIAKDVLCHSYLYRLLISWPNGEAERLPAYVRRVVQDDVTKIFSAEVWNPQEYKWRNTIPAKIENPIIYEVHIGMSSEKEIVNSFTDFRINVLPHIASLGYNAIQIMGIQEHPYYGSFGYQVANFYAVSSRFGTPEELKELIDDAHGYGIGVIMDLVHSHSVSNEAEGLGNFDGSEDLYFYKGEQGYHPQWDSRCFDYGKNEVLAFLLSNCKYWLEEYKFDGFRFDGVTSMIYYDHGLNKNFTNYSMYFDGSQDDNALIYLMIANKLIHQLSPSAITIAEDMSGMPGLAVSVESGGCGFDFRLSMGVPDFWIKMIEDFKDEDWWMGEIYFQLTNRRSDEKVISYAESHDQAMVGDKTIIFRLIDKEMYYSMHKDSESLIVDRGIALHKMIRLLTIATTGAGYLTFMGNEYGHPEWIDFPRAGNDWSYKHARRQWSLLADKNLRFHLLSDFDSAMIGMFREANLLKYSLNPVVCDDEKQILIFSRSSYLFVFNFSRNNSYFDYGFSTKKGKYRLVLDTDNELFGGFARCDSSIEHFTHVDDMRKNVLNLYIPARSAQVYKRIQIK